MQEQEQPVTPPFEFREREQWYAQLGHARFLALLRDGQTTIHEAEQSENSYGQFLFVTISRPKGESRTYLTLYGLGYHEYRERWITETWAWYEATETTKVREVRLSREEVEQLVTQRLETISPYTGQATQSKRALLYELLADLTDEDGAISELEDLGENIDWLFGGDEE